jgi:hypothetical protein
MWVVSSPVNVILPGKQMRGSNAVGDVYPCKSESLHKSSGWDPLEIQSISGTALGGRKPMGGKFPEHSESCHRKIVTMSSGSIT